jgi:hypothetical protein
MPQREDGVLLRLHGGGVALRRGFVEPRAVLQAAQFAVGVGGGMPHTSGQQTGLFGALQQGNVAHVVYQHRMGRGVREHEVLHGEFGVEHAAGAVLDVELVGRHALRGTHARTHGDDLLA